MKKNFLCMVLLAVLMFSMTGCSSLASALFETEPEITYEDKKAYVEREYPNLVKNDFTNDLPFKDMIGLPLADLKSAVETSDTWFEENSAFSDFSRISGLKDNIAYSFSNRTFNMQSDLEGGFIESIISGVVAGGANLVSTNLENAEYVYVVTDGTSKQLITTTYICITNTGLSSQELTQYVADKYKPDELMRRDGEVVGFASLGCISKIDYESIYDYDHGLTTEYPSCIGELQLYYADNTLIMRIFSKGD